MYIDFLSFLHLRIGLGFGVQMTKCIDSVHNVGGTVVDACTYSVYGHIHTYLGCRLGSIEYGHNKIPIV